MRAVDLGAEFGRRYHAAADGMTVVTIHLFGIEFADALVGHSLTETCSIADVPTSHRTGLRKDMRLAKFGSIQ